MFFRTTYSTLVGMVPEILRPQQLFGSVAEASQLALHVMASHITINATVYCRLRFDRKE